MLHAWKLYQNNNIFFVYTPLWQDLCNFKERPEIYPQTAIQWRSLAIFPFSQVSCESNACKICAFTFANTRTFPRSYSYDSIRDSSSPHWIFVQSYYWYDLRYQCLNFKYVRLPDGALESGKIFYQLELACQWKNILAKYFTTLRCACVSYLVCIRIFQPINVHLHKTQLIYIMLQTNMVHAYLARCAELYR